MRFELILTVVLALVTACGDEPPVAPLDAGPTSDSGVTRDGGTTPRDGGVLDERFRTRLETAEDLAAVSSSTIANVKYLFNKVGVERTAPLTADCYFQNMRLFEWHLLFLQSFDAFANISYDVYLDFVLRAATRRWWGGAVQVWAGVPHPETNQLGVMSYVVYDERGELTVEDVVEVDQIVKTCAPFAADILVFVPDSVVQKAFVQREGARLNERGVQWLFPEELVNGLSHVAYSEGEGYGTLRVVPAGQRLEDYGPHDVVVVESAPNDISVVQGLITKDPQNALSHTNLRLLEKRVPNVAVPRIYEAAYLSSLADQLVHLVVADDRFVLEPARLEDAEAFWAATRPTVPAPRADLTVQTIGDYADIGHDAAVAYGAKAANIAELDGVLPAENRPAGFAIPFARYVEHVVANGLDTQIDALLADPRIRTDAAFKRAELKALRTAIKNAPMAPELLDEIEAHVAAVLGPDKRTARLRFRSSTNVEDLDVLTGAGLYDSKSGCIADDRDNDELGPSLCLSEDERLAKQAELDQRRAELALHPERLYLPDIVKDLEGDLTNERSVARAVRKVWASLWNARAFDERAYYGIDHRQAFMGIAVNESFVLERASAVAITELDVDGGDPLYRLSSQVGSESVVRPADPTAIAEALTFRRTGTPGAVGDVQIQVRSSRLGVDETAWTPSQLDAVGALLFAAHDHFESEVYPHLAPLSFDVELKHTRDGRVVIKQLRPFVSTGP